jgi:GNAT superfamily N-acetyltransferase
VRPETDPTDPAITAVLPADVGEVLTLQRAAYATEARLYHDPELPALTQTLAELATELTSVSALKAVAGHRIVGAVRARVDGTVLHVGRLVVAPDWQNRGVGSRLLAAVEAGAGPDVRTAALFTGHLSSANLALYARRGYAETRREQLRPGVVLVHLNKPLGDDRRSTA